MADQATISALAKELYQALKQNRAVEPLTERYPGLSIEDAYQIQKVNVEKMIAEGARIVGKKIGLTSLAMQQMLGVFEPDFGQIFDRMVLAKGELSMSKAIQPKAEGEIAFVLKDDLAGPGVSAFDVIRATDFLLPAIEIIDSRIKDWKIKIQDTVADNASSAFILAGSKPMALGEVDLFATGMVILKNGRVAATAAAAAVMDNPLNAVAWLANKLAQFGGRLKKGEIILSGSLAAAVPLKAGDLVEVVFDRLGSVRLCLIE